MGATWTCQTCGWDVLGSECEQCNPRDVQQERIAELEAKVERLRQALHFIAQEDDRPWTNQLGWYKAARVAKTALKENNDE